MKYKKGQLVRIVKNVSGLQYNIYIGRTVKIIKIIGDKYMLPLDVIDLPDKNLISINGHNDNSTIWEEEELEPITSWRDRYDKI